MSNDEVIEQNFAYIRQVRDNYKEINHPDLDYFDMIVSAEHIFKKRVKAQLDSGAPIEDAFKNMFPTLTQTDNDNS